jgi:DNA invertase Pin-like site-specific DNA recombinase
MATILYARVSTTDQTIAHQRTQAEAAGFVIDKEVIDDGVSGVTTKLAERPGGKRLFDMLRAGDTLAVRWVDRLGRNYEDVSDNSRDFMRRGVIVKTIVSSMTFDGATEDPMAKAVRDALIGFMAALSQAQAEANKESQRAGVAHAKTSPDPQKPRTYIGRKPSYTAAQIEQVTTLAGGGTGVSQISQMLGLSRAAIYRIQKSPADAHIAVQNWA